MTQSDPAHSGQAERPDPAGTLTAGNAWLAIRTTLKDDTKTGMIAWTIYREDGGYAAREFQITGGAAPEPTRTVLLAGDIGTIRDYLSDYLQLVPFMRSDEDPEEVVETWL